MPDQYRADIFLKDFREHVREGNLPQLTILLLPNDHTNGTSPGLPTPRSSVADNDLALGRIVEAISKSRYWKEAAIFVVEDDAQNGVDHVAGHRTIALIIGRDQAVSGAVRCAPRKAPSDPLTSFAACVVRRTSSSCRAPSRRRTGRPATGPRGSSSRAC